jgi:hypothetical protein
MKYVLFELSMPNNNAWNGKWSQEGKLHCRVRAYPFRKTQKAIDERLKNVLSTKGCYYNFGDGWGAYVSVRECAGKEKTAYNKRSQGFCGYDWMIDELERYGRILERDERQKIRSGA